VDGQRANGGRTVIADSNLFLYRNTDNPGYWLRYSYDGVFPNTGEYCDQAPDPDRWQTIQAQTGVRLEPWRVQGDHILLCLQRDGGWSMAGWDVIDWAVKTIAEIRKYTDRPIRIRPHPGDKRAIKYCERLLKLCIGRRLLHVHLSKTGSTLMHDFKNCCFLIPYRKAGNEDREINLLHVLRFLNTFITTNVIIVEQIDLKVGEPKTLSIIEKLNFTNLNVKYKIYNDKGQILYEKSFILDSTDLTELLKTLKTDDIYPGKIVVGRALEIESIGNNPKLIINLEKKLEKATQVEFKIRSTKRTNKYQD
jgi:hypothetical protein